MTVTPNPRANRSNESMAYLRLPVHDLRRRMHQRPEGRPREAVRLDEWRGLYVLDRSGKLVDRIVGRFGESGLKDVDFGDVQALSLDTGGTGLWILDAKALRIVHVDLP